jgi:hypothetical protein
MPKSLENFASLAGYLLTYFPSKKNHSREQSKNRKEIKSGFSK